MSLQFELGAKKVLVTFTPNKTLGEGLAEFCKQNGLDAAAYTLKKGKQVPKFLSFSLPLCRHQSAGTSASL